MGIINRLRSALSTPEKHQKSIALKTLKMSPAGASTMGGMDHKEAVAFLIKIGYSRSKIEALLKQYGHSSSEIKSWIRG